MNDSFEGSRGAEVYESGHASQEAARILREEVKNAISAGHQRSLSGSILSKFSFLRLSVDPSPGMASAQLKNDSQSASTTSVPSQSMRTRSRKGSLRKTAILGGGRLKMEVRERKAVEHQRCFENIDGAGLDGSSNPQSPDSADETSTSTSTSIPKPPSKASLPHAAGVSHDFSLGHDTGSEENLVLSATTRNQRIGDLSTTDEDEASARPRALSSLNSPSIMQKPARDSYFPALSSGLQRRRSAKKANSPLSSIPVEAAVTVPEEWDYSETEAWGWVILTLTWIVFVVGMGSCFDVWTWAWDVGETPYAPPELEDDPTLPIVGYYPALITLTFVMAWVWVVIAWIGMKYFKHAKIAGEDI